MSFQRTYHSIYDHNAQDGKLQLLFYNLQNSDVLFFDGIDFTFKPGHQQNSRWKQRWYNVVKPPLVPKGFHKIKFEDLLHPFEIEELREESYATVYIKLTQGDIFHVHQMMDDENGDYLLHRYTKRDTALTPLGISIYEAMLKNYNNAELIELK